MAAHTVDFPPVPHTTDSNAATTAPTVQPPQQEQRTVPIEKLLGLARILARHEMRRRPSQAGFMTFGAGQALVLLVALIAFPLKSLR
ncbi:hypothetical protein FBZ83_1343 [Azospirillum brasilense]|uniref:Uncharacterized protein n=1 Tax=Azospirillum brasilense TaxID=192 RepID=A0A560BLM3_AZOBR|nr:hypothetical protein [Azospirillum brasilense]TWA73507.1 hypothetical protein FBZ83_1343 [Azospirillum brasilense]